MPKTKEKKAEYNKQYNLDNKEEIAEYQKQYRLDNKEKIKEYQLDNKEKLKEQSRQRYLENREKILEKKKEYAQTPQGKKSKKIGSWKFMGLLWENQQEINQIYERYLNSKRCELCDVEYTETIIKNMDHSHTTGKFRNVLCHRCNSNTDRQDNKSGVPNVFWDNIRKKWIYCKKINKKPHRKKFPYFIQAVIYKKEYEASLL